MDFRQKLDRLRLPGIEARSTSLAALRRQMADILGRLPAPRAPAADPTVVDLPFARVETAEGPLYQRVERLRRSHHVGRMPVDAALAARAEALALLALDPGLAAVVPGGALFLDTETTGLSGSGTIAFLVGLATFDDGELVIEQLLLRT